MDTEEATCLAGLQQGVKLAHLRCPLHDAGKSVVRNASRIHQVHMGPVFMRMCLKVSLAS